MVFRKKLKQVEEFDEKKTEKKFVEQHFDEKNISIVMIEYFNIFKKRLTSKKYVELFYF
jgi:hypothetical protein